MSPILDEPFFVTNCKTVTVFSSHNQCRQLHQVHLERILPDLVEDENMKTKEIILRTVVHITISNSNIYLIILSRIILVEYLMFDR